MMKRILPVFPFISFLLLMLLLATACSELGSWDRLLGNLLLREIQETYGTRMALSVDGSGLSAPLLDFPVLVVLNNARTGNYDSLLREHIRFVYVDEFNMAFDLDYEIERWGPNHPPEEHSYIWVRIPKIKAGKTTIFRLYYNTAAPGQPQNPAGVWRDGYELVYHFAGAAGAGDMVSDSTAYGRDGVIRSESPTPGSPPPGEIGLGFRLEDATRTCVDTGWESNLGVWTLEAWLWPDAAPSGTVSAAVLTGPIVGGERYNMVWDHSDSAYRGVLLNRQDSGYLQASFGTPLNGTKSYYLAGTYALGGTEDLIRTHTDGVLQDQIPVGKSGLDPVTTPICLGSSDAGLQVLNGIVDEVRISSQTRSGEYILYQYLSMQDSLISYGLPEPL